jgi:hypothetical protein
MQSKLSTLAQQYLVSLEQGWPTFLVKGQNYLKNDFKGHFNPQS